MHEHSCQRQHVAGHRPGLPAETETSQCCCLSSAPWSLPCCLHLHLSERGATQTLLPSMRRCLRRYFSLPGVRTHCSTGGPHGRCLRKRALASEALPVALFFKLLFLSFYHSFHHQLCNKSCGQAPRGRSHVRIRLLAFTST